MCNKSLSTQILHSVSLIKKSKMIHFWWEIIYELAQSTTFTFITISKDADILNVSHFSDDTHSLNECPEITLLSVTAPSSVNS